MYLTLHRIKPRRRKPRAVRRVLLACLLLGAIPLAASAALVATSRPPRAGQPTAAPSMLR
jgi:hypothetical protein